MPAALPGVLRSARAGPSLPTDGFFCRLPPPPDQVRGPEGACLVPGLDPDHKVRDRPGISGEMLLAKPWWLQGPDRKPPSRPCGFPAPTTTDPRAGAGAAQPPLRSPPRQRGPACLLGNVCTSLEVPLQGAGLWFRSPPGFQCWGGGAQGRPGWGVRVGLTWEDTAGSVSPARRCRKQVNSLMVGIFSDVPRKIIMLTSLGESLVRRLAGPLTTAR